MKRNYLLLLLLLCFVPPALADDIDIYGVSDISVKPNVLIVFDNSGSMGIRDVPKVAYDPTKDYSYDGGRESDTCYQETCGWKPWGWWWYWSCDYDTVFFDDSGTPDLKIDSGDWLFKDGQASLQTNGYWEGNVIKSGGVVKSSTNSSDQEHLRLGNYLNFLATISGDEEIRMVVAKQVIADLIYNNSDAIRFGVMKFNNYNTNHQGGFVVAECGTDQKGLIGSYDPASTVFTDSNQTADYGAIGGMYSETYTPLAETLGEAGLYFAGKDSWFDGTSTDPTYYPVGRYSSSCTDDNSGCQDYVDNTPIQYRCQKNYIIVITDGEPTVDNAKFASNNYISSSILTEATDDGNTNYMDDVSYFLAHNDLLPVGSDPTSAELLQKGEAGDFQDQTITTYTIGFQKELTLLKQTADNGGGEYYTANNASSLSEALNSIITNITKSNEGFSAAAVPVSRANKAYAGEFVYYGLFQPLPSGNWIGNLKKYGITNLGVIQDADGNDIVSGGTILENSRSYWSTQPDGPAVDKGGAGEKLYDDIKNGVITRKIYTYTATDTGSGLIKDLTDTVNEFSTANTLLTSGTYSGLTTSVIGVVRHEDGTWPLGSLLHSQPLVVHYNINDSDPTNDVSLIFAGANDGMLHSFDDADGSEKWGFIPRDLLGSLNSLEAANSLKYFVDESPILYSYTDVSNVNPDRKLIIFGERRGGSNITALDVSDYDTPLLRYEIDQNILRHTDASGTTTGEVLGQSWGKALGGQMATAEGAPTPTTDIFVLPGGYDTNQDNYDAADPTVVPAATDSMGRAVYAINSQSGALFDNFNFSAHNFASMTHSIISVSAFENPHSRTTTRVYAGDMNGNLFGFRDDIFHRNKIRADAADFDGNYNGREDGVWGQKVKIFSSAGQKIFYAPNIINEYFLVEFTYPAAEIEGSAVDVVKDEKRIGDYVFYGSGDRANPDRTNITNSFYAIKNNWQWASETPSIVKAYIDPLDLGKIKAIDDDRVLVDQQRDDNGLLTDTDGNIIDVVSTELFIIDVTADLFQNQEADEATRTLYTNYVKDAINHPSNRGWYIDLVDEYGNNEGEKVVSSPIIYGGVVYFTTYIPEDDTKEMSGDIDDPCENPGAKGEGFLYAIGYQFGESVRNNDDDPTSPGVLTRKDRRKELTVPGIPPEPVLVIHEGKPTIITGFETDDPVSTQSIQQFYWRQQ